MCNHMKDMKLPQYYILIYVWCSADTALSCSTITHVEIAERTREHFAVISEGVDYSQLLNRHEDAFQAGAPYPDAYYPDICAGGEYHQVSEDTHWTPFINATVNYIREVYQRPWNRTGEKMVVFLLSTVTHQVADVNWHSLGIDQGFLTTMGNINYHGSYGSAHVDGDFGGDVLNLFGFDMSYIGKLAKWYVPVDDLLNIYEVLYNGESRITREVIEACTTLLFLGRLGENIGVVDKLYPVYARRSPFMTDRLQDYYLGGMDDMSVWSMNVWMHTVDMLDHGTDVCDLDNNPIYITCNTVRRMKQSYARYRGAINNHPAYITAKKHQKYIQNNIVESLGLTLSTSDIKIKKTGRGIRLTPRKRLMKAFKRKLVDHVKIIEDTWRELEDLALQDSVKEPEALYSTLESYSRLGETLLSADVNNDGYSDLVVGAPGYSSDNNIQRGRVYIIYGSEFGIPMHNLTVEEDANVTINGSNIRLNGRFGHALSAVDINADGYNDLVISAPSEGSQDLNYQGRIYIYFGGNRTFSDVPGIEIGCTQRYCNFGWTLGSGDLNGDGYSDLLIGSPFAPFGGEQRGFVGVLYANQTNTGGNILDEEDLDWVFAGNQDYGWVGYSVSVASLQDGSNWLAAGAPTFRNCSLPDCTYNENDVQSVGRVYGFSTPLSETPSFIITGSEEFQQLGFSLFSGVFGGDEYLFVTSATADSEPDYVNITQGGKVELYAWLDLTNNNISALASFNGDRAYGRFGFNVQTHDFDGDKQNDLLVTAALRSGSFINDQESGRAFLFRANETYLEANTNEQAYELLGVNTNRLRFGYDSAIIPSPTGTFLALGIPHFTEDSRIGGGVAVYNL